MISELEKINQEINLDTDTGTEWIIINTPFLGFYEDTYELSFKIMDKDIILSDCGCLLEFVNEFSNNGNKLKEEIMNEFNKSGFYQKDSCEIIKLTNEENFINDVKILINILNKAFLSYEKVNNH